MEEVRLVTQCSKYEEAWEKLLTQLWEYAKQTSPDSLNFSGTPEELEEIDDGKALSKLLKLNNNYLYLINQCSS